MAIQNRRGLKKDFDPTKMLPGEWAVTIDPETENQMVYMCFAPGVVKRMGTYEDFKKQLDEAAVDREQIQANKTDISNLEQLAITSSASGTQIVAKDSSNLPLKALTVYGRTEQFKTTGAQLFDASGYVTNQQHSGVTIQYLEGEDCFLLNGTATAADISTMHYFNYPATKGDTYTVSAYFLSGSVEIPSGLYGVAYFGANDEEGKSTNWREVGLKSSNNSASKVCDFNYITSFWFYFSKDVVFNNYKVRIQLQKGEIALPYEPYTGGKPSPSPDYPQAIVNAGQDGGIELKICGKNLTDIQTATIASANGLPGIPVSSGGNYTDESGQQWVCDTIEYRGGQAVYVRRVWSKTFTGGAGERWYDYNSSGFEGFMCQSTLPEAYDRATGFCNSLKISTLSDKGIEGLWFGVKSRDMYVHNSSFYDATLSDKGLSNWKAYLAAHPMTVMTYLTTPIETPLTEAEAAQLAALHTYKPTTTVTNDAGVGMDMTYIADTKVYIDTNYLPKNFAVVNSWADVQNVVRLGMGHLIFPVGYEFTTLDSNTGQDIVWVVRGHNHHKAADESLKYTMTLEAKHVYSKSSGAFLPLQFSAPQAAYYAVDGLPAGTYHFTGSKLPWNSSAGGKKYQFTINNAIPAGGQIVINMTQPSSYDSCKIDTFSGAGSSDPIESGIVIAEGEEGTHLGTIYSGSGNMNIDTRVLYGSNNYAQSTVRQWLNSINPAGSVWTPATNFDRPPKWNVSAPPGFMNGLPEDFLDAVQQAVVPCYANATFEVNSCDGTTFELNTAYTLRDKFFLLSVPEIYPVSGLKQLEYYGGVTTNADRIKYDINGTKTLIWLRLNSSGMSDSYVNVMTTNGNYSTSAAAGWVNNGVCPACIIA